jgi:hypothetical protein
MGTAYYADGGASVPDWNHVVASDWPRLRSAAWTYVMTHPPTALRMMDAALRATSDPTLSYLPSDLLSAPAARVVPPPDPSFGEQGADGRTLAAWLAGRPLGLVPSLVIGAAVVVGTVAARGGRGSESALAALGVTAAGTMVLVAAAAVMGDGYFELAKHTWPAAYAGAVAVSAILPWCGLRLARAFRGTPAAASPDDAQPRDVRDQGAATTAGSSR